MRYLAHEIHTQKCARPALPRRASVCPTRVFWAFADCIVELTAKNADSRLCQELDQIPPQTEREARSTKR